MTIRNHLNPGNTPTKQLHAAVDHQAEAARHAATALRALADVNPMASEFVREKVITMRKLEAEIRIIATLAANTPGCNQEIVGDL